MSALDEADLEAIEARLGATTPGPWEFHAGTHTDDPKTSDAGGLRTRAPVMRRRPDGRAFADDNVVFPIGRLGGDPYWLQRFVGAPGGRPALTLALELFVRPGDAEFIVHAQDDVRRLLAEVRRLRAEEVR